MDAPREGGGGAFSAGGAQMQPWPRQSLGGQVVLRPDQSHSTPTAPPRHPHSIPTAPPKLLHGRWEKIFPLQTLLYSSPLLSLQRLQNLPGNAGRQRPSSGMARACSRSLCGLGSGSPTPLPCSLELAVGRRGQPSP